MNRSLRLTMCLMKTWNGKGGAFDLKAVIAGEFNSSRINFLDYALIYCLRCLQHNDLRNHIMDVFRKEFYSVCKIKFWNVWLQIFRDHHTHPYLKILSSFNRQCPWVTSVWTRRKDKANCTVRLNLKKWLGSDLHETLLLLFASAQLCLLKNPILFYLWFIA